MGITTDLYIVLNTFGLDCIQFLTFQISLPTGTKVYIDKNVDWEGVLDVTIFPSVVDIEKSSGLCGNFDGNRSNDVETVRGIWSAVLSPTETLKYRYESIKND